MDIAAIIGWVMTNGGQIVTAVLAILGGFSLIAKLTPTQADDKVIDSILKVIHTLGLTRAGK
jgi:hypothetical protein